MTENNFSFTPMANEDISIHIGSVPGAAAESGAPAASASPVSAQQPEAESIFGEIPAVPPHLVLTWSIHKIDTQISWCEGKWFSHNIPPDWCAYNHSSLASSLPLLLLANQQGENRFLFAVSEALRQVGIKAGVREEDNRIECSVELFREPEAPLFFYEVELRFDFRSIFYADAIRDAMEWFAAFPEYLPAPVPAAAFEPVYSS